MGYLSARAEMVTPRRDIAVITAYLSLPKGTKITLTLAEITKKGTAEIPQFLCRFIMYHTSTTEKLSTIYDMPLPEVVGSKKKPTS